MLIRKATGRFLCFAGRSGSKLSGENLEGMFLSFRIRQRLKVSQKLSIFTFKSSTLNFPSITSLTFSMKGTNNDFLLHGECSIESDVSRFLHWYRHCPKKQNNFIFFRNIPTLKDHFTKKTGAISSIKVIIESFLFEEKFCS